MMSKASVFYLAVGIFSLGMVTNLTLLTLSLFGIHPLDGYSIYSLLVAAIGYLGMLLFKNNILKA